ncbi:FadR/GntR family transcriptional regulator, partial [Nocardia elegans]|uniref:FadR/GntR family transcriptional regulator n=1 Tax=Nocardia elegans TaxID=300029 RepID=UPI001E65E000
MEFAVVGRTAVSDAVFGQLVDAILTGRIAPDEPLPAERELAETFQVNRHAVREALKRVQQSGLVRVAQGGKTRVLDWRANGGLDLLSALARSGSVPAQRILRDIAEMQARGLRLDAIREVFDVQAQSGAPADWRAVLDPRYPGAGEQSAVLDDDQLTALLGDRRADILDELIAAEYLHRCEGGWRIPDQPMLKGALILYDLGTDITLSGALRKL